MRIDFASFSNVGPRATNQDRYLEPASLDDEAVLVAIADGMGGAAGGGEAASLAIAAAREIGPHRDRLEQIFIDTTTAIRQQVEREPAMIRMGTTLSVATIDQGHVYVAHVGDTRVYHLRGSGLNNLTQDQTEIAELVRRGVFTEREAKRYPRRNVLLSALTAKAEYELYRSEAKLEVGDRLVLLSDGVHQRVMRGAVLNASLANASVQGFVAEIERRAIASSPSDNFTLLAVEICAL